MFRKIIMGAAIAGALALPAVGVTSASASVKPSASFGCRTESFGTCASWQEEDTRLVWAVGGAAKSNAPIVVQQFSNSREDQDFQALNVSGLSGPGGPWKRFEYAPSGDRSGLCISDINQSDYTTLRLRPCNNSVFQQWIPTSPDSLGYNGWQSAQDTHAAIQDPSFGETGTDVNVGPYEASDNQQWEYNENSTPLS